MPFKMDLDIKEEVDDKSFILQNYQYEFEESEIELKKPKIELFQCEDCSEQFQIFELYELHKRVHGNEKICPHCKRTILKLSTFVKHIEDHIKNYIQCEYCPKIFFGKQIYNIHKRWHRWSEKRFQCTYCNRSFFTEKNLSIHVKYHTEKPPFKCDHCDKTFKCLTTLRNHYQSLDVGNFPCDVCDGTFRTSSNLKRHKRRIHDAGHKMTCKLCSLDFLNQKSFYAHRQQQHLKLVVYNRKCQLCNLEFTAKHKYFLHRRMHLENGDPLPIMKPMIAARMEPKSRYRRCTLCRKLVDETHLKQHQDTHVETTHDEVGECGLKSAYRCKECGEVSTTKIKAMRHLDEHMKKTHACEHPDCRAAPSMTYMGYMRHRYKLHKTATCDDCKRQFKGKAGLGRHRVSGCCPVIASKSTKINKRALSLRVYQNSVKPYKCNHCGRRITGVKQMRHHIATKHAHRTDQKIAGQCKICNERFETKTRYEDHMKKRHGPQYVCVKCKSNFTTIRSLKNHVKRDACNDRVKDARQNENGTVTCLVCSRVTTNIHSFYRHIEARHPYTNQDIFCKYCTSSFSGVATIKEHLEKQHPDEDKYVCPLCSNTFKSFHLHLKHKKEHSEKRVRRTRYVVQLNEIISRAHIKKESVDDNFVGVPEHVVVQQNGEVLSIVGDQ